MRCDDLRTIVADGAPLEEAARAHLAACAACGEEFAALRALTSFRPAAPEALRGRVLASFPARASRWTGLARAAAVLILGLGVGFVSGYAAKKPKVVEVPGPTVTVEKVVEKPVPDDYVSNVAIAAERIYGGNHLVEVTYVPNSVRIQSIVVDPRMRDIEKYCPVARQLGRLAERRPDVVAYRRKEH